MTLADTPASRLRSFPSFVRRLAIALVVALVTAAAICVCHLTHRPVGYSGNARISSFISPDFASGFDVAWEMTASELGVSGQLYSHAKVDNTLVAIFKDKDQPPTLVAIDLRGTQPSVLWRRELAESSAPILTWDDSIVVDGQTIRVSDGQVTATWEFPIPDSVVSGISDKGLPLLDVGQDLDRSEKMSFVAVQWPVAVMCHAGDMTKMFQDYDYMCLGYNKDGTEAWRYKVNLSPDDLQGPGLPLPVTAVDGYVPVSRNFGYADQQVGAFLHLADGVLVESATYNADALVPVADGWLLEGGTDDPRQRLLVTLAPDGTEVSRTRLADPLMQLSDLDFVKCWDEEGRITLPTSEQAASTLTSGEIPWASVCVQRDQHSKEGFSLMNGRRLMATNGAGGAESGTYPESLIPATDGSLILSQPPKDKDSTDKNPPMNLYTAPSGIQLASLEDVGAHHATLFYDDLLIAYPARSDSWSARLYSYLGTYPHPDTVLMGITPKRAG